MLLYLFVVMRGREISPFFFMYFVIWKPKDKFTSFTNVLFATEKAANEFMEKNKKRKIEFKVVPYDKENYDKYWYK